MRVMLTTDRVLNFGAIQRRGQEIEIPPDEALRLIQSGQAEAVVELTETAMDEPRSELRINRRKLHGTPVK
jgi:hypothetical protein